MYHFCTYFDRHYLPRGLALYQSLMGHATPFTLYVLCFDKQTYEFLVQGNYPNLKAISLEQFEEGNSALLTAKVNRSRIEYYFTCTPSLPLYVVNNFPNIDIVTYLDADLFFYASPAPIYEELGEQSILMIGHRFPEDLRYREKYGIYNVGYLSFRNDDAGKTCLRWWRDQCIKWCYDKLEDGKYADQKYLDDWSTLFNGVVVLQHKGAGLAPWNLANYDIHSKNGSVKIDSEPLIFYHFHGLKVINQYLFDLQLDQYAVKANKAIKKNMIIPYLRKLQLTIRQVNFNPSVNVRTQVTPLSPKEILLKLIYRQPIFMFGPVCTEVMLYPFFQPLLKIREIVIKLFQKSNIKTVY